MAVPAPLEVARTHLASARVAAVRGDLDAGSGALELARAIYASLGLAVHVQRLEGIAHELGLARVAAT